MAVAAAGPYANHFHFTPDRKPCHHVNIFTGWCPSWRPTNRQHRQTVTHIITTQDNHRKAKSNQQTTVRSVHLCALHCAQLVHTILYRTDLIIFPLPLTHHTIIIAPMMSVWAKGRGNSMQGNPDVRATGDGARQRVRKSWRHPLPLKCSFPTGIWANWSPHPKRHLDRLGRFCRAHSHYRQTDHSTPSVAIGHI